MIGAMKRPIGLSIALLLSAVVPPQLRAESATTIVHAGQILDVRTGSLLPESLIRIEDGLIVDVSPATGAQIPAGAVDLSSLTVLPGLIDAHTHLCDNTHLRRAWDPWTLTAPAFGIIGAANAVKTLEAGFTTVRNMSEPFYAGLAIRDAIEQGLVRGPRVYASGPMISMTGGHGDWGNWMGPPHDDTTPAEAVADGADEVRRQTRRHIKHGVDWIKIAATGGFSSHGTIPGAASYTVAELQAAVEEAAKRGLSVAAHAHGSDGIRNAIKAGVRSIEHGALIDEESIQLMKETGAFLVADLFGAHYDLIQTDENWAGKGLSDNEKEYRAYCERIAKAYRAGVKMAFGTDSGATPHGRGGEQFALMVECGVEPIDAMRSATIWAAELLGIPEKAGSIDAGKWADLIAVDGNPLADTSVLADVRFVMKQGVVEKRTAVD